MPSLSSKRAAIACLALAVLLLLASCTFPALPQFGGAKGTPAVTPDTALTASGTPSPEDTPSEPEDIETATSSPDGPVMGTGISAQDFSDPANLPHGLILFASTSAQPFEKADPASGQEAQAERYLWAISLDGKRAGRVSPDGAGSALFVAAAGKKNKVLQNGFQLSGEQIEPVDLPDECTAEGGQSCSGYQFSPSGNMLAYFSGSDSCGRKLTLYNLDQRKEVVTWPNAHWAYFFNDGSLITSLGDCDSQWAYLYIPRTGKQAGVEKVGKPFWNPTHTAVIFQVQGKPETQIGLWGFNLETSRVFMWLAKETVIEDTPIWLADGQNFVFQHQPYSYDQATKDAILNGPRQVILMNAWTRSQRLLGYDPRNSYNLCGVDDLQGSEPGSPCTQPYGNWLRIQRLPYQGLRFAVADRSKPEARCALYGLDCKDKPETLALDWQTGKQYPWDEAQVPQATVTPGHTRPDLNKDPFYQDPNGEFAFYVGKDGKTLWYVPRDREPSLWVQDAEGFVYLP
jgi:hypothetical protein